MRSEDVGDRCPSCGKRDTVFFALESGITGCRRCRTADRDQRRRDAEKQWKIDEEEVDAADSVVVGRVAPPRGGSPP
jgi:Zn ribbon nucleic-acid-binding protein